MTGIIALDIVIGLVFVYIIYSLLATIVMEFIPSFFSLRAKMLENAIMRMLEDENIKKQVNAQSLSNEFYNHPLIKFLGKDKRHPKPSYIKSSTFSKVILDLLKGKNFDLKMEVNKNIELSLKGGKTQWSEGNTIIGNETLLYLCTLWTDANADEVKFKAMLENWFDETMERATGWYKRRSRMILFFIGFILAVCFNVDTIRIASKLEKDPKLREQLVQQADAFVKAHPNLDAELKAEQESMNKGLMNDKNTILSSGDSLTIAEVKQRNDSISKARYFALKAQRDTLFDRANKLVKDDMDKMNGMLGLGFKGYNCKWDCLLEMIVGWILTAFAISLGAPFWFDLLNKFVKIRGSVATTIDQSDSTNKKQESDDVD